MQRRIRTMSGSLGIAALALTLALSAGPATAGSATPTAPTGPTAPSPTVPRPVHDRGVIVYEAGDVDLRVSQNAEGDLVIKVPGPVSTASKQQVGYTGPGGLGGSAALAGSRAVVPADADGTYRIRYQDADYGIHTIRAIGEATAVVREGKLVRVSTPNHRRGEAISVFNPGRGTLVVRVPRHRVDVVAWSLNEVGGGPVYLNTDRQARTQITDLPDGHYALSASSGDQAGVLAATTLTFTVRNGWIVSY